ncbi:MAG: Ig-like domain-containing protein, partial [Firmicutes bacterium]|nr:Ig-like domain-containing protein [Bacillota bacterium]
MRSFRKCCGMFLALVMTVGCLNLSFVSAALAAAGDADLTEIRYNGIPIAGFNKNVTDYTVELPVRQKSTGSPILTLKPDDPAAKVAIDASTTVPGTSSITVTDSSGAVHKTYTINWTRSAVNESISKYTSWAGNSFSGVGTVLNVPEGGGWVQNQISDIKVYPDGTVYTHSGYDEGGRQDGVYKDGKCIGNINIDANSKHAELGNLSFDISGNEVRGSNGMVIKESRDVAQIAADLGVIESVVAFSPGAIAFSNDGQLMVADNGTDQIVFYDVSGTAPAETKRIGELYGVSGLTASHGVYKPDAGVIKPTRFDNMTGIGTDAAGNLYVAMSEYYSGGCTILRCLEPDMATQKWQIFGMTFVERYGFDPATNGADLYTKLSHFKMDYSNEPEYDGTDYIGAAGSEQNLYALTIDQKRYPDDPRLYCDIYVMAQVDIRTVGGQKFMFFTGMYGTGVLVYRFDGETAVPCSIVARNAVPAYDNDGTRLVPGQPQSDWGSLGFKPRVWIDKNGDGQFTSDEWTFFTTWNGANDGGSLTWNIDENGNIWKAADGQIIEVPAAGVDGNGVLRYSQRQSDVKVYNLPNTGDGRGGPGKVVYDAANDSLYVLAFNSAFPDEDTGNGRVIYRFDNFAAGPPVLHAGYPIALPYYSAKGDSFSSQAFNISVASIAVCDGALFALYGTYGPLGNKGGEIHVFDTDTAKPMGYITPGEAVGGPANVGWIDIPYGLSVMKADDGTGRDVWRILMEEDYKGKNVLFKMVPFNGVQVSDDTGATEGVQVDCYKMNTPPSIDGVLGSGEWDVKYTMTQQMGSDISYADAKFGFGWDANNLYIGAYVLDNNQNATMPVYQWENDAIEVFVDGANSKGGIYDAHTMQYIVPFCPNLGTEANPKFANIDQGNTSYVTSWTDLLFAQNNSYKNGVRYKYTIGNGNYQLEMSIPWSALGVTVAEGSKIGFDIAYDDSMKGAGRNGGVTWAGDGGNFQSNSKFATVTLAGAQGPVVDKTELNALLAGVGQMSSTSYTSDSWAALMEIVGWAKGIAANAQATQENVNQAVSDLQAAIDNLAPATFAYATSWLGNTYPGIGTNVRQAGKWVQEWAVNAAFAEGAVFTATNWDEAGRCTGIYKDGDVNSYLIWAHDNQGNDLDGWGWGTSSYAVAVNASNFWIFTDAGNLIRYAWDPNNIHTNTQQQYIHVDNGGHGDYVIDLAEKNNTLYALWPDGTVQVYDGLTLALLNTFSVPGATRIGVNPNSDALWAVVGTDIKEYSLSGAVTGRVITDAGSPNSVTFDAKDGYLMTTDNGARQQVLFYDVSGTGAPVLVRTFGDEGGIGSGTPGEYLPMKFFSLVKAGTDADGNVYVVLSKGETVIRKLTPDGQLVWEEHCFHFTDCATFLPGDDGARVYGGGEIYSMDYSKSFGQEATVVGLTRDQVNYPDDPRLGANRTNGHNWVRELDGRLVQYQNGMYQQNSSGIPGNDAGFDIYVYDQAPSTVARYTGYFSDNGWAWDVDLNGDIWCGESKDDSIMEYKFLGFDANNNPVYDKSSALNTKYDVPAPFNMIQRIAYDSVNDVMYLSGYTDASPYIDWGLTGSVFARYDNWKKGNRVAAYTLDLPMENGLYPEAFDIAGDYVFVCTMYGGNINVYNKNTAAYAGQFQPSLTFKETGWVDTPQGVRATKRSNGEYVVLAEDDWRGKNIIYRWTPSQADAVLPDVSVISPADSGEVTQNELFDIQASVGSSYRQVAKVEYYLDSLKIGESTDSGHGWRFAYKPASMGQKMLVARAVFADGSAAVSKPITINVKAAAVPATDKTALIAMLNSIATLNESDYTAGTWSALADAVAAAEAVVANDNATQADADGAVKALNGALQGLVPEDASAFPQSGPVPGLAGWFYTCIGDAVVFGVSYDPTTRELTVSGKSSSEFYAGPDSCVFVYTNLSGDKDITATYKSLQSSDTGWMRSGLTFRASLDPLSQMIGMFYAPQGWWGVRARLTDGSTGTLWEAGDQQVSALGTMEMTRTGNSFTGLVNTTDGHTVSGSRTIPSFPTSYMAGFAISGRGTIAEDPSGEPGTFTSVFRLPVDKSALNALLASIASMNSADYTPESWAVLADAVVRADAVAANADATQAQVDAMTAEVQAAVDGLVKASALPIVELLFDEGSGQAAANTGASAAQYPAAALTNNHPVYTANTPNGGGDCALDFGSVSGPYAADLGGQMDDLKDLKSFTITGWLNARDLEEGAGGNRVVSWIRDGGSGVDLVQKSNGSLQMGINVWPDLSDTSGVSSSSGKITKDASAGYDNWVFFAVTYDSTSASNQVKYYFGDNYHAVTLDTASTYNKGA